MKIIKIIQHQNILSDILPVLVILIFYRIKCNPSNCETEILKIDQKFLSSNFSKCEILEENSIRLYLSPEDNFVNNPSPWFAFRKSARTRRNLCRIII